jgi:hypothetical protein
MLAAQAVDEEAVLPHGVDMLLPRVDERDVLSCQSHPGACQSANGT